jgi:type II secretory pathway pseudopilin PulG
MKIKSRQSGISLTEMVVVVASVTLLAVFGVPAVSAFLKSFESTSGTRAMIGSALASARAIAAKEQRYVGVRFQKAYHRQGPLEAPQYMIFIVQDPALGSYFFRAVKGIEPIKLPDSVGVMDLTIVEGDDRNYLKNPANPKDEYRLDDPLISPGPDSWIDDPNALRDTTTFSVVFSPSGKLVVHGVRITNRDGYTDTATYKNVFSSDDIFNKKEQVDSGIGMFYQDDYFGELTNPYYDLGLGPEPSRGKFIIYERERFRQAFQNKQAYSGYLYELVPDEMIYINAYTGTIIER